MGRILDIYTKNGDNNEIIKNLLFYGLFLFFNFVIYYALILKVGLTSQKILYKIRDNLFSYIMRLKVSFFDKNETGKIVTRITNDTEAINSLFTDVLVVIIKDFFLILFTMIGVLFINLYLGLIFIVFFPIIIVLIVFFRRIAKKLFDKMRELVGKFNIFLSETFTGFKIIELFNLQKAKIESFNKLVKEYQNNDLKIFFLFSTFRPLIFFVSQLMFVFILYYSAKEYLSGFITIGVVYVFMQYLNYLFDPIMEIAEKINQFQSGLSAIEKIITVYDEELETDYFEDKNVSSETTGLRNEISGNTTDKPLIEFKNVYFAYDNENWILKDFSLKIYKGETLAIVGPTGGGKTTIINILLRFYQIQKGEVLINGNSINQYSIEELRAVVGIVLQDNFLFSGTILKNIKLFEENYSFENVLESSKFVNAYQLIERKTGLFDYEVNQKGTTLSAGERQLICLARSFYFNKPILILDEATANIDPQTEALFQDALQKLMNQKTVIVIAHRLSTIKNADKIIFIKKGEIVEIGTHNELMSKKGFYFELYEKQFLKK